MESQPGPLPGGEGGGPGACWDFSGVCDQVGKEPESLDHHLQALDVQRKLHDGPHPEVAHQLKEVGTVIREVQQTGNGDVV